MRLSTGGAVALGAALLVLWGVLTAASLRSGSSAATLGSEELLTGLLGALGWGTGLADARLQTILELRLHRALAAGAVGASLSLAGAYLQGLYRNGLASPSVVGVTAGSVLGASVAIALIGGYGAGVAVLESSLATPALVTLSALLGALLVTWAVVSLATTGRRLSVPTLLLAGIAMNTIVGGVLAALQSVTMRDSEVSRAILAWTFGTLNDRAPWQVVLVWIGLLLAAALAPFVARELDLMASGEEDAEALGVDVQRVKRRVLLGAALATACAVSVAGQIPFVGLVVPHAVRGLVGPGHRALLPLSLLAGAVVLLGADVFQSTWFPGSGIRPGVWMSLIGGPFFLVLLVRNKRAWSAW